MPYTKNNFHQLQEWQTKKFFMNKGYIPTGDAIYIRSSGIGPYMHYYSPYEVRPMTDAEWQDYIADRDKKPKRSTKPIVTAISKLKEEYDRIAEDKSQETADEILIKCEKPKTHELYVYQVKIYNTRREVIFDYCFPGISTRITKTNFDGMSDAPFGTLTDNDFENIKTIIDIDKLEDKSKLAKLKRVLKNAKHIAVIPNVNVFNEKAHMFTFEELI